MAKIGTSVARKDVNVNDDRVWRTCIKNEALKAKTWEQHFDYLIPESRKELVQRIAEEREAEVQALGNETNRLTARQRSTLPIPSSSRTNPHFSELTLVPEAPQRLDRAVKDKFYQKQDSDRHNAHSKLLKYYSEYTMPPNKMHPTTYVDPRNQSERDAVHRKEFTLTPYTNFDKTTLHQHRTTTSTRQQSDQYGLEKSMQTRTMEMTRQNAQLVTKYFSKSIPKDRYEQKKLTSHEYGWLPSIEFPEKSPYGLRSIKFE